MSSPQLGRDVYWRRRLLVLAVLIAIVWGIVQLVGLFTGSSKDENKVTQPDATPTVSAPTTSGPTSAQEQSESPAPVIELGTQVPLALTTSSTACEPENIRTVAMIPEEQQAGGPVAVELLISTLDSTACTFTPSKKDLLVVIEANDKAVYDSNVCKESFLANPVVIAQGFGTLVRTTWSGRGSGKACSPAEGFVHGGKFTLKVSAYGGEPDQTEFALAAAPKPTPTPTPSASNSPGATPAPTPTATQTPTPRPTNPGND